MRVLAHLVGLAEPPMGTTMGIVFFDIVHCPTSTIDGADGLFDFSNVGIAVETPHLSPGPALTPATFELYDLELFAAGPAWLSTLRAWSFGSAAEGATIEPSFGLLNGDAGPGTGDVSVGTHSLAHVEWAAAGPAANQTIDLVRFWHQSPNGTAFFELTLNDTLVAGAPTACTFAPDSAYANVTGATTMCPKESVVILGLSGQVNGRATFIPGPVKVS